MKNINISELYPHPENPRKDVGDISELTESIKANGVYQNLTVIEGGPGVPEDKTGYTVIIGHRRLAAAKAAGLTELPCCVIKMSREKQISTMLLENIQRSDLTVVEQAQGFQLMLDIGETVESISNETGFSKSTIQKRLEIAKLDRKKLSAACARGGTLEDYSKLNGIKSIITRNKLLEFIGTPDFKWRLENELEQQRLIDIYPKLIAELDTVATKIEKTSNKYEWSDYISFRNFKLGDIKKRLKKGKKYFYTYKKGEFSVTIYTERSKETTQKKSQDEIDFEKRKSELKNLFLKAYKSRTDFLFSCPCNKDQQKKALELMPDIAIISASEYGGWDGEVINKFLEKPKESNYCVRTKVKEYHDYITEHPNLAGRGIIVTAYALTGADKSQNCYDYGLNFKENNLIKSSYNLLTALGYELSTEEQQLIYGTHKLYSKGNK